MKAFVMNGKVVLFLLIFIINFKGINSFAKVLVLVPGYFNTLIPGFLEKNKYNPYWSHDIVDVYRDAGFKVFPVNNLNPVGSIEENGARLLRYLDRIKSEIDPSEGISIIAHSAGSLYTIEANNRRRLPIRKLIAINTPFDGVDFIDRITKTVPGVVELEKQLNIESLNQLRPELVRRYFANLLHKPEFPILGVTGGQESNVINWYDAAFLTPIFYVTQALMDYASDGIVTHRSALGKITPTGINITISNEYVHLDHIKQNLDADYFKYMGMKNTEFVRREQIRFYSRLISEL